MIRKSIADMTRQRNNIQEWLINSDAWQRHPKMYKRVENTWRRYVNNIENYTGKKLYEEHFGSVFAMKKYSKEIYSI
jgi:hypothetical protein